ncbi:MAG: ester cyclase [Acidobacteria bacterium]|nr:ester cyclase [Acidobacteriota bacterium]
MATYASLELIARRWIEEGWQRGNAAVVDDLHAMEFVDHDSAGRPPDTDGFKSGIRLLYGAFPDFSARIEDLVIDVGTGKVAIRWTATGTFRGPYLDLPPTNRAIRFKGIEVLRIEAGCIVERWGEWDGLDLLRQLRSMS